MFQHFLSYLQFGNRFCGVEHALKNDEGIIYVTHLKKAKNEVTVDAVFSSKSEKGVSEKLPKNRHISLIINNEHVLTKAQDKERAEGVNLVNKAFPNINISDFYYEIVHQDKISLISICRKTYIDSLIKSYLEYNVHVLSFSLGNSIMSSTIGYIKNSTLFTSNAQITVQGNAIGSIEINEVGKEESYQVNGLETTSLYLLSLSGALASILGNYAPITNYQDEKNILVGDFKQARFFNQFLKIGLLFILSALLVNFLAFNFYFNKVKALNDTLQVNQATKSKVVKLSESVGNSQKKVEDILKSNASKSSFYVNAIVQDLPGSILLSEINFQPLVKRIKKGKNIVLQDNAIYIQGVSNNSERYFEWIDVMEAKSWVNRVEIESYSDSKAKSSTFNIKINISNDQ